MPEIVSDLDITEYDSDVVSGTPKGKKIKWINKKYLNIYILEEYEPIGNQHLKTEDIVEEIDKLPECIRKHISSIVLSPYDYKEGDANCPPAFASADWSKSQITIHPLTLDRSDLKDKLAHYHTLAHEAGHIIDRNITQNTGLSSYYLSYTPLWAKAMCEDSKIKRFSSDFPPFIISKYAEERQSIGEDFADSVMYFSYHESRAFLKEYYPNRYKILEEFIESYHR